MATFASIGSEIESIIRASVTKNHVVYGYIERNPSGYPAINIDAYDGNGEFADTSRNRRSYIFRITVMQERLKVGAAEAERITRALVDEIISTFDSRTNITLNNTCDFAFPIPAKWGYIQAPDIDVRTAEILLEAVVIQ